MALSRLRHPVITLAPSLFRARFLSTYHSSFRSLARCSSGRDTVLDGSGSLLRPFSMITGVNDKLKLQIGFHHFSSTVPSHTVIGMPALSPTMTQGNIAKWKKKEGDKIEVGDVLCEIETDKATLEFESLEEGFLAKILAPEGSKDVPVGQPIAITVEDTDDIPTVPATISRGTEVKEAKSIEQDAKSEDRGTDSIKINTSELPPHIVLEMPALSPTMNQGNIARWRKKEGDKIEVGDIICEIETDKATLEFETLEEGYLAKILAPEGSKDVAVGQPIAVTVENLDDIETVKTSISGSTKVEEILTHHDPKDKAGEEKANFTRISPSAKLLILEHGLDPSSLKASGSYGTLLKSDVLGALKSGKGSSRKPSPKATPSHQRGPQISTPAPESCSEKSDSFEDVPNTQIRKVIARRLLESKQTTPHLYLSTDVILDPLLSFRKELKEQQDIKVSVNDIVIKAVAISLRNVPEANVYAFFEVPTNILLVGICSPFGAGSFLPSTSGWLMDCLEKIKMSTKLRHCFSGYWNAEKGEVILCDSVDISIAVATEKGLMTPIVRNADQKSILAISSEVKQLAEKARSGKLAPNEFQGGSFSISNLGMYPVDEFAAIINPPQAGILAVGRGNRVIEPLLGSDGIERPSVVNKMNLTLSADHRVFDGKVGGAFVLALRSNFSDIRRLLL